MSSKRREQNKMKINDDSPPSRRRAVEFLLRSAVELGATPAVKYAALFLFAGRFFTSLSHSTHPRSDHWLLNPITLSNLHLFGLASLWISSKFNDSRPFSIISLKSVADKHIDDQIFTRRDFIDAEVILMQVLKFEIGILNTVFVYLEEILIKFKGVAMVGEMITFELCMDIIDLLYEDEELAILFNRPLTLASAILVVVYVISVPKQRCEFPVLPWIKYVTSCKEEEILRITRTILYHIVEPPQLNNHGRR